MLNEVLGDLQNLTWVAELRASRWVYPLVNTGHIFGFALLYGAIIPLDLRMLGLWRSIRLRTLSTVLVPVALTGIGLAAVMGGLLFAVRAEKYAALEIFQLKLLFVAGAVVNAVLLHTSAAWAAAQDCRGVMPGRLRVAALLSISFWTAALVCGRMVGYM